MGLDLLDPAKSRANLKHLIGEKLHFLFPKGCQKILLIEPQQVPEEDYDVGVAGNKRYPVYPPAGLGILSQTLKQSGYSVDLLEINFWLQKELQTKDVAFDYHVWKKWVLERIKSYQPDLVGITCMFTITYRQTARIANLIKEHYPELPIIAGGVHTSQAAELVFKDCLSIDFVGLYEGNVSFPWMVDFINGRAGEDKLYQIATLINGEYVAIKDRAPKTTEYVDVIPDYHDLPIGEYSPVHGRIGTYYWLWPEGTRAATVLSNVGCRARCTFCSVHDFNGRGVATRSVTNVVDEQLMLKERYGISHIMWLDDDLLFDAKRVIALFNEMVRRNVNMTWDASNGIIASAMTEEIAQAMNESGCIGVSIGVESGNAALLRSVMKPSTIKHFYKCMDILRKYPQIFTKFLLMVGFPDETLGMVHETIKLAKECKPDWSTIQPLNFIPGVPITNDALEKGVVTEQELIDGTERPFVGSTGGADRRLKAEEGQARSFVNLLDEGDPIYVPTRQEIQDIWWVMDYKINYEKLWEEENLTKLEMLRKLFHYIFDKTHKNHAVGNLYFALIELKLGNVGEARRRLDLAREYSGLSQYWRVRFEVMGFRELVNRTEQLIVGAERKFNN